MKGQLLVTEAVQLLEHARAQHLLSSHPVSAFGRVHALAVAPGQVLMHPLHRLRQLVQEHADSAELASVAVVDWDWNQRQLIE